MNLGGALLTILISAFVLKLSRAGAALAIIAAVCYLTQGQQLNIAGFHMTAIRLVLLVGIFRAIVSGDLKGLKFNKIDQIVTLYPIIASTVPMLRNGTSEVLVYQLGLSYDILLSYFSFRCLLNNLETVHAFLHGLGYLILPMAIGMIIESLSGHNLFAWMGGIEGLRLREGRLRCCGAFRSGITAGVFGATLMPIFAMISWVHSHKVSASIGVLSAMAVVYTSNSSGPLMGLLAGFVAMLFWPWRRKMRTVRWGILVALVCLNITMKAPVWYVIARISDITGGDGWYRSELINQFVKHSSEWWLLGTNETGDWMPTGLTDPKTGVVTADMTNQYVACGVSGGIWALWVYILIIVKCFQNLGKAAKLLRPSRRNDERLLWGIGAALFAHAFTIISVTYWDQMYVPWWALLGIISSVTSKIIKTPPETELPTPSTVSLLRKGSTGATRIILDLRDA